MIQFLRFVNKMCLYTYPTRIIPLVNASSADNFVATVFNKSSSSATYVRFFANIIS